MFVGVCSIGWIAGIVSGGVYCIYRLYVRAGAKRDAGKLVSGFRPHLILLDMTLPIVNGFELCRRWRLTNLATGPVR